MDACRVVFQPSNRKTECCTVLGTIIALGCAEKTHKKQIGRCQQTCALMIGCNQREDTSPLSRQIRDEVLSRKNQLLENSLPFYQARLFCAREPVLTQPEQRNRYIGLLLRVSTRLRISYFVAMGSVSPAEPGEPEAKRVRFNGPDSNGAAAEVIENEPEKATLQATDVVQLRFVHTASDLGSAGAAGPHEESLTAPAPFLHQIVHGLGVLGWRKLTVALYIHLPSFSYWIDSAGEPADPPQEKDGPPQEKDGPPQTDVPALLTPFIKAGLATSRTSFEATIADTKPPPLKNRVMSYEVAGKKYAVYKESFFETDADGALVKNEAFHDYHLRMASLMFLHIDGASFIDDEDPRWETFVVAEEEDGKPSSFVGYATTYPFSVLSKDDNNAMTFADRIRISQVLVAPLHQGRGHGRKILHAIYTIAKERNALEVTVEDPSLGFRLLRDVTDLKRSYEVGILNSQEGYEKEREEEVVAKLRKELMLTSGQARRCLEVHQLRYIDRQEEEQYKSYRLWVKRRLFKENYEILDNFDKEERKIKLAEIYDGLEKEYSDSIMRLKGRQPSG